MTSNQVRPVILSGGSGTRLWPVSRASFPKQLLPIGSETSMLCATAERVRGSGFADPIVVASEEHRFFVRKQLEKAGVAVAAILLEPEGRNTAPAATLAAAFAGRDDPAELLLLLPSDHVIEDADGFRAAVEAAIPYARDGGIVTFGARPSDANTQYGYIEYEAGNGDGAAAKPIRRFVEKPDRDTAAAYLEQGNYLWNAGIFLFRADSFLAEVERWMPETLEAIRRALEASQQDGSFVRPEATAFAGTEKISLDYGIMERTDHGFVVPIDIGWSDVGSWEALWRISAKDGADNAIKGEVVAIDTSSSLLESHPGAPAIATVGVENLAVIAVRDAVFVAPLERAVEVKQVVERLERERNSIAVEPSRMVRPWGSYETVERGPRFQVKRIVVDPGGRLSLQMHHHRSEHWIVVRGTAEVTIGDEVRLLHENQSTYIPVGCTHRLANPGKIPLELVEVQCGAYLGEDDIVRVSDVYGRS
ncbi:mannose-1-phosphate guanylyltransferase/mannose-6-phosphate isomerase [Sphingomonas ginkgonis]|uniref:mannose-1-phosphate guanylyltransferase n=1 Tax=Sphingomonas ginkgonis TaxID=2315330 RepID=A0A3R9Z815_9SPHN|nr:mannose-1-phosphate guanylyltransferase/mannose-6-phosphate isomerase [Sphingomonas ginkgonis]RST32014.1 mannose-1-phosphate guanylyltransferase/mannose-6-phosphate isomerase [Sphingomonas ginkgonis]